MYVLKFGSNDDDDDEEEDDDEYCCAGGGGGKSTGSPTLGLPLEVAAFPLNLILTALRASAGMGRRRLGTASSCLIDDDDDEEEDDDEEGDGVC